MSIICRLLDYAGGSYLDVLKHDTSIQEQYFLILIAQDNSDLYAVASE